MKAKIFAIFIFYTVFNHIQAGNQHRSVLLSDVQSLTLHKGQQTQARRVSSIPQLKCVGGSARCGFQPDVVQCYNRGSDGVDVQWECTAQMPMKYRFGKISVSCEGYNYPDDPYILAGSCGLEYHLETLDKKSYDSRSSNGSGFGSFLIKVVVIVAIFFAIRSFLASNRSGNGGATGSDRRPPGGGGGGWFSNFFPGGNGGFGSGWGGGDARRRQPPPPGFRDDFTNQGYDNADCHANRNNTGGGGANFMTGAALGALGGYLFGARNRGTRTYYGGDTGNTNWFQGGGTTTRTTRTPSPSSSSSSYTSSGFGGTTRR